MAIISRIRKHSGIAVAVIAIAMIGFLFLSDRTFRGCSRNQNQLFAKIDGEKISHQEFNQKADEQIKMYQQQMQKENLTPAENFQLTNSVWEQYVQEKIMMKEYEELGLAMVNSDNEKPTISQEEIDDLLMGNSPHPYITNSFTDKATGQFNKQAVQNILNDFDQLSDVQKKEWNNLVQAIKDDRLRTKYNTLVGQGYYMPKALLQRMAEDMNTSAKLLGVGVKYQTIPDNEVKATDEDFQKYYDEHKFEFEIEKSVDLDYVIFEPVPSAEDMNKITEKINTVYTEFQKISNSEIETYIAANSDVPYDSNYFKKGMLPAKLDSVMFVSQPGFTTAPFIDNNQFVVARLVQTQNRPDSIKANHILIGYKDAPNPLQNITRTKEQAKKVVDSLLLTIKGKPETFAGLASMKTEFPGDKEKGGDLGWLIDGSEDLNSRFFYDSCFMMNKGEVRIIQSAMGYHLLYCADKKAPIKKVKVAMVRQDIKPGTETINKFQIQANEFASANRTPEAFNKTVTDKGLNKRSAQYVKDMDYTIPALESAREIIRWAFDEKTEKGMISEQVFDNAGKFVIVMVAEKRAKGIATLEQVKKEIEPLVLRDKKAVKIIEKINAASTGTKDIYQIASKLNVPVDTVDQLTFASYNYPKYGPEPELIGTIFSMKNNSLSTPIKGQMAVYQILLQNISKQSQTVNTDMIKMQTVGYFKSRVANEVFRAIKDKTDILDNRYLFY
jgi:peptidyl-prolyl cis-trans isomerase D